MNEQLKEQLIQLGIPTDYPSLLDWFEERGIIILTEWKGKWVAKVYFSYIWNDNHEIDWYNIMRLNEKKYITESRWEAIDYFVEGILKEIPIKFLELC